MDRLPIELVSHIFTFGCGFAGFEAFVRSQFHSWSPDPLKGINNRDPVWNRFRIAITSVSKLWREIAYSTAELWSFIDIKLMESASDTPEFFVEICLRHSKNKALDIFLYGADIAQIMTIWRLITPALLRCRSLHMIIPSEALYYTTPLPNELNLLEEADFTFDISEYDVGITGAKFFSTSSHLPRLRRLKLRDVYEGMIESAPLQSLCEFTFERYSTIFRPAIFARLSEARHVVLNCRFARKLGFKPIALPHLESIEFGDDTVAELIRAPNLLHLSTKALGFIPMLASNTFPRVREITSRSSGRSIWPTSWEGSQTEESDLPTQHLFMPSVEVFRLPAQDINTWAISLSILIDSGTADINTGPSPHPPSRLFPALRTLYCEEVGGNATANTSFPSPDDPYFETIHEYIDELLIQLLRQRPLLSIVVAAAIMTPDRMESLAPEMRGRVANSDAPFGLRTNQI
ncbi:hypothetical protein DL93DRAFT_2101036 [Clavulina sp. PMI_390]|nr:hypothetical protein DL93DRAFT_2101036 [Clavulina sp. PMI_390]